MAETLKILAQSNPTATTLTDIYTVPAATSTVISSIVVCNRGAATAFRFSLAVAGAADDNKQYLFYDTPIAINETKAFVIGATLAATDKARFYATLATLTCSLFGVERT